VFDMPAPLAITEEWIAEHTKVCGHTGQLYVLPAFKTMLNAEQSYTSMTSLIDAGTFKVHAGIADLARVTWVILEFYGSA
jgi:hypothetical protein